MKEAPMDTNKNKTILRMLEGAAALVMISAGLNVFVMQMLGSFDAAAVILALFVGFGLLCWALCSSWFPQAGCSSGGNSCLRDHFVVWRRPGSPSLAVHVEKVTSRM
jgi:hypothetical protein